MGILDSVEKSKRGSGGGGRNADMLIEVKSFDVENGILTAVMASPANSTLKDKPFTVKISQYSPKPRRPDADMEGNLIDKRMAEYVGVGGTMMIEQGLIPAGFEEQLAEGKVPIVAARWLHSTPENAAKTKEGLITVNGSRKDKNLWAINLWEDSAYGAGSLDGLAKKVDAMAKVTTDAEAARAKYKENGNVDDLAPVQPEAVVMIRGMVGGQVVFQTPAISRGENGVPVSGQDLKDDVPVLLEQLRAANPDAEVEVDVLFGKSYRTSGYEDAENPHLNGLRVAGTVERGPLATMRDTRVGFEPGEDSLPAFGGGAYGTRGVLTLSAGKLMTKGAQAGTRRGEQNDYANQAYVSARKAPIVTLVATESGVFPELAEGVKVQFPKERKPQSEDKAGHEAGDDMPPVDAGEAADQAGGDMPDLGDDLPDFDDDQPNAAMGG